MVHCVEIENSSEGNDQEKFWRGSEKQSTIHQVL